MSFARTCALYRNRLAPYIAFTCIQREGIAGIKCRREVLSATHIYGALLIFAARTYGTIGVCHSDDGAAQVGRLVSPVASVAVALLGITDVNADEFTEVYLILILIQSDVDGLVGESSVLVESS